MDGKRFDALTRGVGEQTNRRGFFKGLAAAVAGIAGVRALEDDASATGMARITIHNAQCHGKPKGDIYEACHQNGFGCVNFTFRGRTICTNANGVATARIGAGSFAISQQASRVRKSSAVYVYCSNTKNGKVLYDGWTANGVASFRVPAYAEVVCDWYNIAKTDLSMPGQCPRATTTPRPTTTTTTTTTAAPADLVGTWCGTGSGVDPEFPAKFIITANGDGTLSGQSIYPTYSCSGTLTQKSASGSCVVFREEYAPTEPPACYENPADVTVCRTGPTSVSVQWLFGGNTGEDNGTLTTDCDTPVGPCAVGALDC